MFEELTNLNDSVVGRYRTVEGNIKGKSNSFYDSYLDLLEHTIKEILIREGEAFDERIPCGTLLRNSKIGEFFKKTVGIDDLVFAKCQDYIAKINKHKHFNEHQISIESVITYMRSYYELVSGYFRSKGEVLPAFDADYYNNIYGLTEREHDKLQMEVASLKGELENLLEENKLSDQDAESFRALASATELARLSLEDQNEEMRKQLSQLKDIKINTIEAKLNKALELLYSLTDSVVESRAIGIAVGKTIIGEDITKTDYMKDALQTVKKSDAILDLLGKQQTGISELSNKFGDMDVDHLYEAAMHHYKMKNYKVAEEFFDHICVLKPMDWRASFYLGLCKTKGAYTVYEFVYTIYPRMTSVYEAAVKQIKAIEDPLVKSTALKEVYGLMVEMTTRNIEDYVSMIRKKDHHGKSVFEDELVFIFTIQAFIGNMFREILDLENLECVAELEAGLSKVFLKAIQEAEGGLCDYSISKDDFDRFLASVPESDRPPYKTR